EPKQPLGQSLTLLDAKGEIHAIEPRSSSAARVLVFITGECPISRSYIPRLGELAEEWRSSGRVELYGVWGDVTPRPAEIASFVEEHTISFPVLVDRRGELARRFRPTHVPEAFVLDRDGELVYRGRIDDTYADLGAR